MADFRKSAPEVGFTEATSVIEPQGSLLVDLIEPILQFEEGFSLGQVERELTDFSEGVPGAIDVQEEKELEAIKGGYDRFLLKLKQKRLRPSQEATLIRSKGQELMQQNPRFSTQISRLIKGLSPSGGASEKTVLEKKLEEAQAQAALEGVSTDIVAKRMGLLTSLDQKKAIAESRIALRSISQDELFDITRDEVELRQQNLLLDLRNTQQSGQPVDAKTFSTQIDQIVESQVNDWKAASKAATGNFPISKDTEIKRKELKDSYQWLKDMANSEDSLAVAQRAVDYVSTNFKLDMTKAMPDLMGAITLFGPDKGFEAIDLMARVASEGQRQALINSNPIASILTSKEYEDIAFNGAKKAFGLAPNASRRSTHQEHQNLEDKIKIDVRKQQIENQADKQVRDAVFNSFDAENTPIQMLSAYGSNKAYQSARTNPKEVQWFKKEWSRQTKANIESLRASAQRQGFTIQVNPSSGLLEAFKAREPAKFKGSKGMARELPSQDVLNSLTNLNRLGGYLRNGWGAIFADDGLDQTNVFESFASTANLDPSAVDALLQIQAVEQPETRNELLDQVEELLKVNPQASAQDIAEFLREQQSGN